MTIDWKIRAFSLATMFGVAYILCVIFDALFPPFGLVPALSGISPFPLAGSPAGYLSGFVLFVAAGFLLGTIYGGASSFWAKRLR